VAQAKIRDIVSSEAYATAADFEQVFTEDMSVLYLLSLLLTGDQDKAEECFVAGIRDSAKGNRVFKEWARSWARRNIIKIAIRLIAPGQNSAGAVQNPAVTRAMDKVPLLLRTEVSAILELPPLERFVFVMSSLERYSDHDCSILLACTRRDVAVVRARAVRRLAGLLGFQPKNQADPRSKKSAVPENLRPVIELLIARRGSASIVSKGSTTGGNYEVQNDHVFEGHLTRSN
jgi:DNA-directed RNA polymerase specialized sigma24 family protein